VWFYHTQLNFNVGTNNLTILTNLNLYKSYLYLKLNFCALSTGANGGDSLITVSSSELVSMQSPSSWSSLANHHGIGIGGGGGVGGHHQMPPMNPTRISPQPALIPTACMSGQMSPTSAAYYQPRQTHPPFYTWYWSPLRVWSNSLRRLFIVFFYLNENSDCLRLATFTFQKLRCTESIPQRYLSIRSQI